MELHDRVAVGAEVDEAPGHRHTHAVLRAGEHHNVAIGETVTAASLGDAVDGDVTALHCPLRLAAGRYRSGDLEEGAQLDGPPDGDVVHVTARRRPADPQVLSRIGMIR